MFFLTIFHHWVTLANMSAKEPRISVRVEAALKLRIDAITARTGIDEATLVRNCIEALCAHVERTGRISFPLSINLSPPDNLKTRYPPAVPRYSTLNEKKK